MRDAYDVIVVGAGAAGIAAGRRLASADVSFLIVEARDRIGGRALTRAGAHPLDLGCGWLHSADRNVWRETAEALHFTVDRTPSPWQKQSGAQGFAPHEQAAFQDAFARFENRLDADAENGEARPASAFLEPDNPWNPLINAVFSYISGASLDRIDARDYARYEDTGLNWRVREGYGSLIAAAGAGLPVLLATPVTEIARGGALRVVTDRGALQAKALIVTAPTSLLASGALRFTPDLPALREAAEALPLGDAEKVFFALYGADDFPADGHVFGRIDRAETGSYHLRPLGRPIIEAYFGGALARDLAGSGYAAMVDFALRELVVLIGASIRTRVTPLAASAWSRDAYAQGAYSYAKPGSADARAALTDSGDERIFFAGEASSKHRYSTAHGAFETGLAAAERALALL